MAVIIYSFLFLLTTVVVMIATYAVLYVFGIAIIPNESIDLIKNFLHAKTKVRSITILGTENNPSKVLIDDQDLTHDDIVYLDVGASENVSAAHMMSMQKTVDLSRDKDDKSEILGFPGPIQITTAG